MYVLLFILVFFFIWLLFRARIANIFNFKINRRLELYIIVPLSILLLMIFSFFYVKFDKQQYYYGFDCILCKKELPYNLEPKFYSDYPQRFHLLNEDGFDLIGKGFKYYTNSFTINSLLAYGYNDTSVVAKVTDSLNNIKYLSSYETSYTSEKGYPEISFEDMSEAKFQQIKKTYSWVNLDEEKAENIRFYKTMSFIGVIISLLILLWHLIRKRKVTH